MMKTSRTNNNDVESPVAVDQTLSQPQEKTSKICRNSWLKVKPETVLSAVLLVLVLLLGLALGLTLALRDCNEIDKKLFQVTLSINTNGPLIETSNSSSVGFNGESSTTWYFPYHFDETRLEPLYMNFGLDGWFDYGVRVRRIDDKHSNMGIKVYFHTLRKMQNLMWSTFPHGEVTQPECTPQIQGVDLYSIPMGGSSEEFALGTCSVTRIKNTHLEPQKIEMEFTGTVSVDRGWKGSPRYDDDSTRRTLEDTANTITYLEGPLQEQQT